MSNEFAKVAASLLFEMDKENFSKMAANDPDMIRYLYPDQWVKFAAFVPGSLLKYVKPLAPEGIPLKKILRNVAQDIRVPKPAFATKKGFADSLTRYGKEFMLINDKIVIRAPKPAFATKKGFADSLARYGKEFMLSNDKIINKSLAKATPLRERASFKAMYNTKDKLHNFEGRVSKDLKTKALLESKGVNSISELSMDELFNLANAGGSGGATGAIL